MATTLTVAGVTGAISAAGATLLEVFDVVYKVVIKPFFIVIKYIFLFLDFIIGNILQIFLFKIKYYIGNLIGEPLGPKTRKPRPSDEVFYFLQAMIDVLKEMTGEVLKQTLVLILTIIISGASILLAWGVLWIIGQIYPYVFQILNFLNVFLNFTAQTIAIGLNVAIEIIQLFAPAWNDYITALNEIVGRLLALVCTGTTTFTPSSDFAQSCPVLNDFVFWLLGVFNEVVAFFAELGKSIGETYVNVGDLACFGGNCPASVCEMFTFDPSCVFSPKLAIDVLNDVVQFSIKYLFPIVQGLVYFWLDIVIFFLKTITGIIGLIGQNSSFNIFISNQVTNPGPSLVSTLADGFLKDVLMLAESFFLGTLGAAVLIIRTIAIIVDTLICNVFFGFQSCFIPKVCYAMLKPFRINVVDLFDIWIDLGDEICRKALKLTQGLCACNTCAFPSPINVVACVFFTCNNLGQLIVPCNGDINCTGCTGSHSILRYILFL